MANTKIPPCLDYTPLEGPPATTEKALKKLKLRRFPASVEDIEWLQYVGHGEEGHVYLARINDYGNVAVKVVCILDIRHSYLYPGLRPTVLILPLLPFSSSGIHFGHLPQVGS